MKARSSDRLLPALVLAAGVAALGTAFTAQFVFGLLPCELCLAQRVPFALAILLGGLGLKLGRALLKPLMVVAGLVFLVNAGIAVYHVGVEQHWWISACSPAEGAVALGDLAAQMSKPVEVRCDTPAWQWHGLTMAGFNILYSGVLALVVLVWARNLEARR